jgi:hypothetical protein
MIKSDAIAYCVAVSRYVIRKMALLLYQWKWLSITRRFAANMIAISLHPAYNPLSRVVNLLYLPAV